MSVRIGDNPTFPGVPAASEPSDSLRTGESTLTASDAPGISKSGSLTRLTLMSAIYQLKIGRFSDVWVCEHGVGWPDVCGECRPLRFPPTEHKFILHRTYTGQGCAMCGQPEGAHS